MKCLQSCFSEVISPIPLGLDTGEWIGRQGITAPGGFFMSLAANRAFVRRHEVSQ